MKNERSSTEPQQQHQEPGPLGPVRSQFLDSGHVVTDRELVDHNTSNMEAAAEELLHPSHTQIDTLRRNNWFMYSEGN